MGDEVDKREDALSLLSCFAETNLTWKQDMEHNKSQMEILHQKLIEVKSNAQCSEDKEQRELDVLWRRVRTTATLLNYLKSKARVMAVPHLAHVSCGITHQDGVGLVDKNGIPVSGWSRELDLSSLENTNEETSPVNCDMLEPFDNNDGTYMGEMFNSVQMVTEVMESLVKRVIVAESEAAAEKEKVNFSKEEIKKKALQIAAMSAKVEEMEKFAVGTNSLLKEMRQKVEDMVQETSIQRHRATENEQELSRVKRDFESLRSYVSSLINIRETLISSEKQFQTMERLFERLIAKTSHLETEKEQKEAEVQKLLLENGRLSDLLDKKEAQLLAMSEQCKFMALNRPDI